MQIEGGRKDIESQIEDRLNHGARGVVVRVAIYSQDFTQVPVVEVWGEGETPLIGVGNGLNATVRRATPGLRYDPDNRDESNSTRGRPGFSRERVPGT